MTRKKGWKREKSWSKKANAKGKGVEYSAVNYYKKRGIYAFRIDSDKQVGVMRSIDYVVVLKGIFGQGKYKREYLFNNSKKSKEELERIDNAVKTFSHSALDTECAYRDKKGSPVKFSPIRRVTSLI